MIAYSLYKNQKKIYVENLANRHRTTSRRSRRIEIFHHDFFNDSHVDDLRDAADLRLTTYVKEFTDEAKNEVYRELAQERDCIQAPIDASEKSKTINKWIFGVSTSITATIVLGVLVDLDRYFPSIDPFPDVLERQAETPPTADDDLFKIEPAAPPPPPIRSNHPVM